MADCRISFMVMRNFFTTADRVKNPLQEAGGLSLPQREDWRAFTVRRRKVRLNFSKEKSKKTRNKKKTAQFWKNILWNEEIKINIYQSKAKKRVSRENVEQFLIQGLPHHL